MAGTQIDGGWEENVLAAWDEYAETRLGPEIRDAAKRYCPVETGALRDSVENHMGDEHALIVKATGGAGGRTYAAYLPRIGSPRVPPVNGRCRAGDCAPRAIFEAGAFYAA